MCYNTKDFSMLATVKYNFDTSKVRKKNLEEIQDQIMICAKREIKVKKRNKSLKKK